MFFGDDGQTRETCPHCHTVQDILFLESLNFGHLMALCDGCETEWDYTPIDTKAIHREAKRGFVYTP